MVQGLILSIKHGYTINGWWYFQLQVPKRLLKAYGCSLIKHALGTKDDIRAAQMIAALAHRYKKEFELVETGQIQKPKALDQAAKHLLKRWGLAANSVHNDQTLEEVFIGTLYDKDEKGIEISSTELRAAELLAYKPKDKTDILLSEMPAHYLSDHEKPTEDLAGELERTTRFLIDSIGSDIRYKDLTREHIKEFRDYLTTVKGNKTGTVKRRIDTLKPMFRICAKDLGIKIENPAEDIRIRNLGKDAKKRLSFTDQELESINLKLDLKTDIHLAIRVLLESTGRLNEIIGLEVADLYLNEPLPYIAIRPNSNRKNEGLKNELTERNVPIVNPETLAALKEWLKEIKGKDLFPKWAKQTKTKSWGAGRPIKKFFSDLGIEKSAHHTRHTNAAQLRKVGCPDSVRCDLGGWTNNNEGSSVRYGEIEYLEIKAEWLKKALAVKLGN